MEIVIKKNKEKSGKVVAGNGALLLRKVIEKANIYGYNGVS